MTSQCVCGDPYCPSCGDPFAWEMEELCNDLFDEFMDMHPLQVQEFIKAGRKAAAQWEPPGGEE